MVSDYSKASQDLAGAAKQAAFPAPVLLRQHQQIFDRFNSTGRSSFDKAYMAEMVTQHSQEVQRLQQESQHGRVQSLKQLASAMLPDSQQRLALATETASSVGADVTASTTGAGQGSNGN
jgi:putative membrane protein